MTEFDFHHIASISFSTKPALMSEVGWMGKMNPLSFHPLPSYISLPAFLELSLGI